MIPKEKEIELLKKLMDMKGYFAEFFEGDFEQMSENIKNDYPIEFDTKFNGLAEHHRQQRDELVKKHTKEIINLCDTFLCVHAETGNERLYERAIEKLGINFVIARKRQIGLDLSNKEIDYMISKLDVIETNPR